MKFNYLDVVIYNRAELASRLSFSNHAYTNKELLIRGYQVWGESLFNKINGDFAFSFYDNENNILYAARDALGVKALYYVVSGEKYYFSHNIDTLFILSGIEKKPNLKSMKALLHHRAVEYEDTMYEGIYRIPQGHYLKVTKDESQLCRYWYPETIETDYGITLDEASVQFCVLFEKAIIARIGNDGETAYELSGGLDSSSIVSMLKKKYPQKEIDTYSMCFDGLKCDELVYINSIEEKYSFRTRKISSQNIDYKNKFDFKFNYKMNPHWPITTTFTMMFPMIEKMHRDEKKIIITGHGGDHLLTGSCMILGNLLQRREFGKLFKELKSVKYPIYDIPRCILFPIINLKVKKIFRKKSKLTDLFQVDNIDSSLTRFNINMLASPMQSLIMDGNALHTLENIYNVEFRHPFYDKNLIEFVLSLPPEYLYSKGWIKMLLRYSMEDILPNEIRSRGDKANFTEIIFQQLNGIDYRKILLKSNLVSLGLIEQKEIDRLIYLLENKNYKELLFLWTIVNLEYWYTIILSQK